MAPITLAIPFFSRRDYLEQAVESVRAQSDPDWRLVISDDGIEDQGVEDYATSLGDDRVRYHRNPRNLGITANWNRCIDLAETEMVTLLHGDDLLEPGYVALMNELAGRVPSATAFFCEATIIDAEGRPSSSFADSIKRFFVPRSGDVIRLQGEEALRLVMAGNFIMCPTLCYRKSRLAARRFDTRWRQVQDLDFTAGLLLDGDLLIGAREPGYAYRRHDDSMTTVQSESLLRFEEEFALFAHVAERARARGWSRAARTSQRAAIVKLHLAFRGVQDLTQLRLAPAGQKLHYLARHLF